MGFKKGMPRPVDAGRKPGSLNKKTLAVRETLESHGMNLIEMISKEFPDLKPAERVTALVQMLPYVYPKLTSVQVTGDINEKLEIVINDYRSKK